MREGITTSLQVYQLAVAEAASPLGKWNSPTQSLPQAVQFAIFYPLVTPVLQVDEHPVQVEVQPLQP